MRIDLRDRGVSPCSRPWPRLRLGSRRRRQRRRPEGRRRVLLSARVRGGADRRRRVSVTNLTPPGSEPHDVELTPRDVAHVQKADLVALPLARLPARGRAGARARRAASRSTRSTASTSAPGRSEAASRSRTSGSTRCSSQGSSAASAPRSACPSATRAQWLRLRAARRRVPRRPRGLRSGASSSRATQRSATSPQRYHLRADRDHGRSTRVRAERAQARRPRGADPPRPRHDGLLRDARLAEGWPRRSPARLASRPPCSTRSRG